MKNRTLWLASAAVFIVACENEPKSSGLDDVAESYTQLVLALGEHDNGYVDAYYGPDDRLKAVKTAARTLDDIRREAESALSDLADLKRDDGDMLTMLRREYLGKQLEALVTRVDMLSGHILSFDEEAAALYDADPPVYGSEHFQNILDEIDALIPGDDSLANRMSGFVSGYVIPSDRLPAVFEAAIEECRKRTKQFIDLPEGESFEIEYVNDKPWSGYNWYKGNRHSLIQINTDLPIYIERATDLGCHEGYPGHHTYNVLLETKLVDGRGWDEFAVYPLFSPQSLIAEGSANFGIDMAFPGEERIRFEKETLFPLAGLDPTSADLYYQVHKLRQKLTYAGNEAARAYLNGDMNRQQTIDWLVTFTLVSRERAEQRISFYDAYRSYVINYNLGKDLVRQYVENQAGKESDDAARWRVFSSLLASPRLPSGLAE